MYPACCCCCCNSGGNWHRKRSALVPGSVTSANAFSPPRSNSAAGASAVIKMFHLEIIAETERGWYDKKLIAFCFRGNLDQPIVYNAPSVGCTWGELVNKGKRASSQFPYPTFRIRGIGTSTTLHWIMIFLCEWLPSFICDTVLFVLCRPPRWDFFYFVTVGLATYWNLLYFIVFFVDLENFNIYRYTLNSIRTFDDQSVLKTRDYAL